MVHTFLCFGEKTFIGFNRIICHKIKAIIFTKDTITVQKILIIESLHFNIVRWDSSNGNHNNLIVT